MDITYYERLEERPCSYCETVPAAGIACCDDHEDEDFCSHSCAQDYHELLDGFLDDIEYDRAVEAELKGEI